MNERHTMLTEPIGKYCLYGLQKYRVRLLTGIQDGAI